MFSECHISLPEVKRPVFEVDHLYPVPSLRMSTAIPLLLYAFVAWKVATSPCLLYRCRYLEDLTLRHEWVLVLTATTATGQPLLSSNAFGLHYFPISNSDSALFFHSAVPGLQKPENMSLPVLIILLQIQGCASVTCHCVFFNMLF
jgi:hypothetical protein